MSKNLSFLFFKCCDTNLSDSWNSLKDHHTLILCTLSLYLFILAVKENKNIYWFLIPIFLGYSYVQTSAYCVCGCFNFDFNNFIYIFQKNSWAFLRFFGLIVTILFTLLYLGNIELIDFISQYFLYPKSLGESRLDWLLPLEFKRFVWRFKLHYLSISLLIFILINQFLSQRKILLSDKIIITGIISMCLISIIHQLMTINAIFIYCLIPVLQVSPMLLFKFLNKNF